MTAIFIKIIVCQFVFLLIYEILLKRETFFVWNRFYLLTTAVLSILIPFMEIELFSNPVRVEMPNSLNEVVLYASKFQGIDNPSKPQKLEESTNLNWENIWIWGMYVFYFLLTRKFYQLYQIKEQCTVVFTKDHWEYRIPNSKQAFSFWNDIFIGEHVSKDAYNNILKHEQVHVKQKHTLDLMFFEIMRLVLWFNPLVYVYQKRMAEVHEFIADQKSENKQSNYELLLQEVFGTENFSFTNAFYNQSLIKKRIVMLSKKSNPWSRIKFITVIPTVLLLIGFVSPQILIAQDYSHLSDDEVKEMIYQKVKAQAELDGSIFNQLEAMVQRNSSGQEILTREEYYKRMMIVKLMAEEHREKGLSTDDTNDDFMLNPKSYSEYVKLKQASNAQQVVVSTKVPRNFVIQKEIETLEGEPFALVDQVPQFENCALGDRECFQVAIQNHIRKNFVYPKEAMDAGVQGRVFCSFIIQKDGQIALKGLRGPDASLENVVYDMMMKLPKLKPAMHNGQAVAMSMSVPITFKLD